jgi:hypothetical protein
VAWATNGAGGLESGESRGYAYDFAQNLAKRTNNGYDSYNKSDFVYDGKGRLRRRLDYTWAWNGSSYAWSSTGETRYVYDAMLLVQQRTSSGHHSVTYTRGSDLSGSLDTGSNRIERCIEA